MAGIAESSSNFPEDADVLMSDPFLDYINGFLMDEGMDDTSYLQQVDATSSSYQAIFNSLQDILQSDSDSVSHDPGENPTYLQEVEGTSSYQAVFSSLQAIIQSDPAIISHRPSNLYHRSAVESNDGLPTDAVPSSPGKDAVAHGHKGQEQCHGTFKPPASADEEFSSDPVEGLDLSFEDLKVDDVYTSLYVDGLSSSTIASSNGRHKLKSTAGKGRFWEKHTSKIPVCVDVREVLISCAQAVAIGDARKASQILQEIHQVYGASARGTGLQRIAYIFSRALAARMRGRGMLELEAMFRDMPSSAEVLRVTKFEIEEIPYRKIVHYYANQSIVQAAEGASRLHILDYGLMYGLQWPCLINALADRKGKPPLLAITFIDFPQRGLDMARKLDEGGRRLAAYAKTFNVPFEYHVIVRDKWEDLDTASLRLCADQPEVLVVNCMTRLRHVADDTTTLAESTISARQKFFAFWRSLNPHLLVTTVVNSARNSPFFVSRFREALDFFSNMFDTLDTLWGDIPARFMMERGFYYPCIMNIVACEGAERVERSETYKQWHVHITKAGFEQVSIPSIILARSKSHVKQHYHKDFLIYDDEKGWMLIGWKGRALLAISAWKPDRRVS